MTVVETPLFLRKAEKILDEQERMALVIAIGEEPEAGEIILGTGGVRKFRLAGRGFGKSGGYRIISYFGGADVPVFLLAALSKGQRANFSKAECQELKLIVSTIAEGYRLTSIKGKRS